jgi:hypothetical protein
MALACVRCSARSFEVGPLDGEVPDNNGRAASKYCGRAPGRARPRKGKRTGRLLRSGYGGRFPCKPSPCADWRSATVRGANVVARHPTQRSIQPVPAGDVRPATPTGRAEPAGNTHVGPAGCPAAGPTLRKSRILLHRAAATLPPHAAPRSASVFRMPPPAQARTFPPPAKAIGSAASARHFQRDERRWPWRDGRCLRSSC